MNYKNLSSRALLDMAFVASLKEDQTEYEEIMEELDSRIKPKKEVLFLKKKDHKTNI